jgi:hypothetical protein
MLVPGVIPSEAGDAPRFLAELFLGSVYFLMIAQLGHFLCPRCENPFNRREPASMRDEAASRCASCGIRVGTPKDP